MSTQVTGLWDSIINANQNLSDIQYKFEQLHDETRHYSPAALNQYAEKHRGQMKLFVTEALVIASAGFTDRTGQSNESSRTTIH